MKTAVCAIAKDEERDLPEWLAYQFVIGFDSVIVFDNNSTDGTTARVRSAASAQDVRLVAWPTQDELAQKNAYEHCIRVFGAEFDWIAFLDIDEFLCFQRFHSLKDMLDRLSKHSAVAINWAMFGSSGHNTYTSGLVIEDFVMRATSEFAPNRHVKSIVRPQKVDNCANPHSFNVDGSYCLPSGEAVSWEFLGLCAGTADHSVCQVNHYFTKSAAHWNDKMRRGYLDGTVRKVEEFAAYDRNEVEDLRAAALSGLVRQKLLTFQVSSSG